MEIQKLQWDTDFFGYDVGKIEFDSQLERLEAVLNDSKSSFRLITVFTPENTFIDAEILNKYNGLLADQKVVYTKAVKYTDRVDDVFEFEAQEVNERLLALTYISGKYSRYRTDKNFMLQEFERLYKKWIESSVKKELADKVLTTKEEDTLTGFATVKIKGLFGEIGLIAIDENMQGRGLGLKLINAAEKYLHNKKIEILNVATQKSNLQACIFYEKIGFEVKQTTKIYHFWF